MQSHGVLKNNEIIFSKAERQLIPGHQKVAHSSIAMQKLSKIVFQARRNEGINHHFKNLANDLNIKI